MLAPSIMAWLFPGTEWFHSELVPTGTPSGPLDASTTMAIWQLVNCIAAVLQLKHMCLYSSL